MTKKWFFSSIFAAMLFFTACNLDDVVTPEPDSNNVKASFTVSTASGESPLEVIFDGSTSTSKNGAITSWAWNFGDGQYGNGMNVTHTYLKAGTFTASLTITDEKGGNNATSLIINVTLGSKIYVNVSYSGSNSTGSQQAPFKTITDALKIASDTQTIYVLAGTYNESIALTVAVTLSGEAKDKVIVIPSGDDGITIEKLSANAAIRGITIKNAKNCGIYCGLVSNLKISDCIFQDNKIAIKAYNNANPTIENCSFINNQTALSLENNSSPEVKDCTIQDNTKGVFIDNNASPRLSGNTIKGNESLGIGIENRSAPTLDLNIIESNGGIGLNISVSSTPILSNNKISLNNGFDVKCTDDYSNFTDRGGNTIDKCGGCLACGEENVLQVAGRYEGTGTKDTGTTVVRALEIEQDGTNLSIDIFNQENGVLPTQPNDSASAVLKAGETTVSFISNERKDEWTLDFSVSGKITGTQLIVANGSTVVFSLTKVD